MNSVDTYKPKDGDVDILPADQMSDAERRHYRTSGYIGNMLGSMVDVMYDSSAIYVLYFAALGVGSAFPMIASSIAGFVPMLILIPCAALVRRFGMMNQIRFSVYLTVAIHLLMASAPFFGAVLAPYILLIGIYIFCIGRALFASAWLPLTNGFLRSNERGGFFGFLRFAYQLTSLFVLGLLGVCMPQEPSVGFLQCVVGIVGLIHLGRIYFLSKIIVPEAEHTAKVEIREALKTSIRNTALVGFSVYNACMCVVTTTLLPLALVYLKNGLHFPGNVVQILSVIGLFGAVSGYYLYGGANRLIGTRNMQILLHVIYIAMPLCFFILPGTDCMFWWIVYGALLFLANAFYAWFYCMYSQEALALARPGNGPMAIAFSNAMYNFGTAGGRIMAGLFLGTGLLADNVSALGLTFSSFQTIFMLCAGIALFNLVLLFALPSMTSRRYEYYKP